MKPNDELKSIARDIYFEVKFYAKRFGMLPSVTRYKDTKKDVESYYLELRSKYNLSDEENHKVDHYFFKASILGSRKDWKERKKEGDKDG